MANSPPPPTRYGKSERHAAPPASPGRLVPQPAPQRRPPTAQPKAQSVPVTKTVAPPAARWPGGGTQKNFAPLAATPAGGAPRTVQNRAAGTQPVQPARWQAPPPPARPTPQGANLQRKKARPDLAALRSAVRGQVSKVPGACLAQTEAARNILKAHVEAPGTELRAALLEWIEDDGKELDPGNHIASYVSWNDGDYVVDTTWKQFDTSASGDDVFFGSLDEWKELILSKQKDVRISRVKILDALPTDGRMQNFALEYAAGYREKNARR